MQIDNKGSSLYFALAILAVVFGISLGLSAMLISQIRMTREMGDSVVAFYAADTGIEHALKTIRIDGELGKMEELGEIEVPINGEKATYQVEVSDPGDPEKNCEAENLCIKSVGKYRNVKRAIEIDF